MKIKKIKIGNFKSLKDVTLENLIDVNMLYGYNNSGKSNLFKFLELVFSTTEFVRNVPLDLTEGTATEKQKVKNPFWDKTILNQPFIFRKEKKESFNISFSITIELDKQYLKDNLDEYEKFEENFFQSKALTTDLIYEGTIEKTGDYQAQQKTQRVSFDGIQIFSVDEESNSPKTFEGIEGFHFRNFESLMSLFNNCVLLLDNDRYFINEDEDEDDSNEEEISAKNFKNKMFSLSLAYIKDDEFKGLNKFLKSFFKESGDAIFNNNEKSSPFKNFNFEFIRLKKEIEIILTNDFGQFPLNSFGTGVQQIIFILTKICLAQKKIVLIEEIELNLSPKYQFDLIEFISEKVIKKKVIDQLFFTTHSPLMCFKKAFRTLQSRIDDNGITTIMTIKPKDEDVAKLWEAMKLLEYYHPSVVPAVGQKIVNISSKGSKIKTVKGSKRKNVSKGKAKK